MVQLPGREHHLAELVIDHVPVVVHVHEPVVGADLLELGVGGEEGPVLPQADVLDGGVVPAQVLGGEVLLRGELLLLDLVQPVGLPRGLDVVQDERPLLVDLVGGR
jgi:hypothetical protein